MNPKTRRDYNLEGDIKIPFGMLKQKRNLFCHKTIEVFDKETTDFLKNEVSFKVSFTTAPEILNDDDKEII